MTEIEKQQLINELKREVLDHRSDNIDWWLKLITRILTFFTVFVTIVTVLGYFKFEEIRTEGENIIGEMRTETKSNIKEMRTLVETAERFVQEIEQNRDKSYEIPESVNTESVAKNNETTNQVLENIRKKPEVTLIDRAITDAVSLQDDERWMEAIEKWKAIANLTEGTDNSLAARAWFSVGYLLYISGQKLDEVIEVNAHVIRLNPDFVGAYNNRGLGYYRLGRHNDAIADFNTAIQLKHDYVEAYNNRGASKNALGLHSEAITDYNEAIKLKHDYAKAYNNRGVSKNALGLYDGAITDLDEAIRLKPDFATAYNNRGVSKHRSGLHVEAITDYNEAIRLKSDYAVAYNNRGVSKSTLGLHNEAITDFDEAIRLKSDYVQAYINRDIAINALRLKNEASQDINTSQNWQNKYPQENLTAG